MSEGYKEEFEQYLKEKEGQPINPQDKVNALRELELGEKGGYPTYVDEKIKGHVDENIDMEEIPLDNKKSIEEIKEAISELKKLKEMMNDFLRDKLGTDYDDAKKIKLIYLKQNKADLRDELIGIVDIIEKYDFDDDLSVCYIPQAVDTMVENLFYDIQKQRNHGNK